ncbi:hypothetical protein EYF80_018783 [Liparis tanakae]|uniref:Uncharacterized protein n=1 Tax=Liparis tanakae TaxID=230148 RepID=A0A4Z2HZ01_9TELE|nr:hypothetical protein EYF80_018783 [Liparis tanakae]
MTHLGLFEILQHNHFPSKLLQLKKPDVLPLLLGGSTPALSPPVCWLAWCAVVGKLTWFYTDCQSVQNTKTPSVMITRKELEGTSSRSENRPPLVATSVQLLRCSPLQRNFLLAPCGGG